MYLILLNFPEKRISQEEFCPALLWRCLEWSNYARDGYWRALERVSDYKALVLIEKDEAPVKQTIT